SRGPMPRALRLSSWPIAVKLSLVLLAVSLAPMGVTAALDVRQARAAAERAEVESLEMVARSSAGRLGQLLDDTRRLIAQVAGDAEVIAYLTAGPGVEGLLQATVQKTLGNVTASSDDIASAFLLDARGTCVITTRREELGLDLSRREYYRE